jgi:aminoglycoside phosphotransferase (APT) family kinase protein
MRQWDPEVVVDASAARRLIARQAPELADAPMEVIGAGWDNTVVLVDGRWTFRFPRRQIAVPGVRREIELLPRLAGHLPLPVPQPMWVGVPDDAFRWPWFGAGHLGGRELPEAGIPDDRRAPLAEQLGEFLRALHAPMLRSRLGAGMPIDPNRRADMAFRVPATRTHLERLAAGGLWQPPLEVEALLADAARLPPSPHLSIVHGDLHARHVLVDGGRVTGVIDWGDVCLGDPAIDLSIAYAAFHGQSRAALLERYGTPVDALTELRARVIGLFLVAVLLEYAVEVGLRALRDESGRALARVVA